MKINTLAIVVPCFNEEEILPSTISHLQCIIKELVVSKKISANSCVYYIDDGSGDSTWQIISTHAKKLVNVRGIKLSKNSGHQSALLAGLLNANGDVLISIDADLQDDTSLITQMLDCYNKGYQIVYGVRSSRGSDSYFKKTSASLFYKLASLLGVKSIPDHADFRLMSRQSIEALREHKEVNLYLRALIPTLGFSNINLYYQRGNRDIGETKYTFRKMIALAIDGITSFSVTPLRIVSTLGGIVFAVTIILSIWVLWLAFFGTGIVPGWASIVLPVYFIGGLNLLAIGILGEYIGKIYTEVKARPPFIIEKLTQGIE